MRYWVAGLAVLMSLSLNGAQAQGTGPAPPTVTIDGTLIDKAAILRFSPRARADIVLAILARWKQAEPAGLNTRLRLEHFMAQIATETGGLVALEENLNYSASRLREVFPTRVTTDEQAQQLAHKPIDIANCVYNGRLGNNPPMDGWTYRGSGLLQLTGRSNFKARGAELKLPLEANPDLVRTPDYAMDTAVAYWAARKINVAADADDVVKVRLLVNGGSNGLAEARIWLGRARKLSRAAAESDAVTLDESTGIQDRLDELGFLKRKPTESTTAADLVDALRRFQESKGIPATGQYDDATLYELTDPMNFKKD